MSSKPFSETASESIQETTPDYSNMYDKFLSKSSDSHVVDASFPEGKKSDILTNITEHLCNRTVFVLGNNTIIF